jgi:hypothetical protein
MLIEQVNILQTHHSQVSAILYPTRCNLCKPECNINTMIFIPCFKVILFDGNEIGTFSFLRF